MLSIWLSKWIFDSSWEIQFLRISIADSSFRQETYLSAFFREPITEWWWFLSNQNEKFALKFMFYKETSSLKTSWLNLKKPAYGLSLRISSHLVIVGCQFFISHQWGWWEALSPCRVRCSWPGGFSCRLVGLWPNHCFYRLLPSSTSLTTDVFPSGPSVSQGRILKHPSWTEQLGCHPFGGWDVHWGFSVVQASFTQAFSSCLPSSAVAVVLDVTFSLSDVTKISSSQTSVCVLFML